MRSERTANKRRESNGNSSPSDASEVQIFAATLPDGALVYALMIEGQCVDLLDAYAVDQISRARPLLPDVRDSASDPVDARTAKRVIAAIGRYLGLRLHGHRCTVRALLAPPAG